MSHRLVPLLVALSPVVLASPGLVAQDHRNYEVGQAQAIAVSADGSRLFALNTPDDRLVVYSVADPTNPRLLWEINVGLRPVSIRERNTTEIWVTNRLGDSISVVDLSTGNVRSTIRVGDEPCDLVFAKQGNRELAFVTLALEDRIVVLDATTHAEVKSIPIFGKEPTRLAVSNDGKKVYTIVSKSGNKTTIIPELEPSRPGPPKVGAHLPPAPRTGTIVDSDDPKWKKKLNVNLPDNDVVEIDVATLAISRNYTGVGTILFDLTVDPRGQLWVANTEALNRIRFEPKLRGHFVDNRVTRIVPAITPGITAFDLNPGIDYTKLPNPTALASSISQPTDIISGKGAIWVAGYGTDRIGVLDSNGKVIARIDIGPNKGTKTDPRNKRGPRALALHPTADRLYVLNRIRNSISVVDTKLRKELSEKVFANNPEAAHIRAGRGFLYDAKLSGNGTASCAGCHIDGGIDQLAWDLGDPDGQLFRVRTVLRGFADLHPAKGPLTTQTLKGLKGEAPLHWRADKSTFDDFNGAFDALMGGSKLSKTDMTAFRNFVETIEHMPNPNQERDRSYSTSPKGESASDGHKFFSTVFALGQFRCVDCHAFPTGSDKRIFHPATLTTVQPMKVAPLRTVYRRLGRVPVNGQRKSGFGLLHEGSEDDVFHLLSRPVFQRISRDAKTKRMLQRFVESFDTGTAPAVGYSLTVDAVNANTQATRDYLQFMSAQHSLRNVDFVGHGRLFGKPVQMLWNSSSARFDADVTSVTFTQSQLVDALRRNNGRLTFLGVPPGSGRRFALDRDRNGKLDGDEAAQAYGNSSPACSKLALRANSVARIDNREFGLALEGSTALNGMLLAISPKRASAKGLGLDFHVDLLTSLIVTAASDPRGTLLAPMPVPNDTSLAGAKIYAQGFALSKCAPQGLEASNGLEITVQR